VEKEDVEDIKTILKELSETTAYLKTIAEALAFSSEHLTKISHEMEAIEEILRAIRDTMKPQKIKKGKIW
jgi:hypothetical protein